MRKSLLFGLTLAGLFDSLYLLWTYTSPSRPMVCLGTGCDVVRASVYAHLWGVPLPAFGVLMYAVLALLSFAEPLWPVQGRRATTYALAAISAAGFLFSLYLTYLQGFVIHGWCVWCEVSGVTVTLIAVLAVPEALRALAPLEPPAALARVRAGMAILIAAILVGAPAFYLLMQHGEAPPPQNVSAQALERLILPDSHATGNLQAPLTIVEFGDLQCPYCRPAEKVASEIREKYGERVRFVFRQFPLVKLHANAEKAAEATECAAQQGKFWETLDKLYAEQADLNVPALKRYAVELGLDPARFNACLDSGAMAARVKRDADEAHALGLNGTPVFFIGSRVVAGYLAYPEFAKLVDEGLAAAGTTLAQTSAPAAPKQPVPRSSSASPKSVPKPRSNSSQASDPFASSSAPAFGSSGGSIFSAYQSGMGCSEADAAKQQPTPIHTTEAQQLLASPTKPLFVDVRPPKEFASGRIPGAVNIPAENFEQRWTTLPKDRTLVLYESGRAMGDICAASRATGRILLSHGFAFDQVKVYQDGFAAWEKAGLPVER